jgi:stage III sporulation protein AG
MDIKSLINKYFIKSKKKVVNLIILFLCGVLLILIGDISSSFANKKTVDKKNAVEVNNSANNSVQNNDISNSYEDTVKKELIDTLSVIDGVGKISVMIHFEGGAIEEVAKNYTDSSSKIQEKDNQGGNRITTENNRSQNVLVINQDGATKPFVLRTYNPTVAGIVIVAEGADDAITRERLLIAVETVMALPKAKISIMPMKKNNSK